MTTAYITPQMLKTGVGQALGVDWDSLPTPEADSALNLAVLEEICWIATDDCDTAAFQPLRATVDVEQLEGPDHRLSVETSQNFVRAVMQHWPILQTLGGQVSPSSAFPFQWSSIPANSLRPASSSMQFVALNAVGSSSGDGMNEVHIQSGYVDWVYGRNGYVVQIAYVNGWPTAGIDEEAAAGSSTIHVDDVTGWAGARGTIFGGTVETIDCLSAVADNPLMVLSGAAPNVVAQCGPGTLTLASPTRYAHGTNELASGMPNTIREAAYYFAGALALQRGATMIGAQSMPGSESGSGAASAEEWTKIAKAKIGPFAPRGMTLNAIQHFVKDVLDGVKTEKYTEGTLSFIKPPNPGKIGLKQPHVYVWGAKGKSKRSSIPRQAPNISPTAYPPGVPVPAAWRERNAELTLWVYAVQLATDDNEDGFPCLLEAIEEKLLATSMPAALIDPTNGRRSQLMDLGENLDWEYDVDRTFRDQRMLRNLCVYDLSLTEMYQG